jgi:hypothetical protein
MRIAVVSELDVSLEICVIRKRRRDQEPQTNNPATPISDSHMSDAHPVHCAGCTALPGSICTVQHQQYDVSAEGSLKPSNTLCVLQWNGFLLAVSVSDAAKPVTGFLKPL